MLNENRIARHLLANFEASWNILRQSIENVPDEMWAKGIEKVEIPWSETEGMNVWYFSERVYHIIETVEFYNRDDPSGMQWGGRIGGIDWKKESPQETATRISKDDMLEYLEKTRENLKKKLSTLSDDDMFEKDGFEKWQPSRLYKYIYTLRHNMWHIGELSKTLREYDCQRTEWK